MSAVTFYHSSPEAVVLDETVGPIAAAAERAAEAWVTETHAKRFHAIDVVLPPLVMSDETDVHAAMRNAVTETFGEPDHGNERYIRFRVVTNAGLAIEHRARQRGLAVNNWHTDFQLDRVDNRIELHLQPMPRKAVCLRRLGTRTLSGVIETDRHAYFSAASVSMPTPEEQMGGMICTLTGADDQFVRGPSVDMPELALRGALTETVMPTAKWYQLDPSTAHDSTLAIPEGGIIISLDDIPI